MLDGFWTTELVQALFVAIEIGLIALSVILTIHILLYKSDPRSSIMWIALVWFAPVFGAVFYILFGINRISRRAQKLHPPPQDTRPINKLEGRRAFTQKTLSPLEYLGDIVSETERTHGNDISLIEGIEDIHAAMVSAIDTAQHMIALETYIFRRDALGRSLADALVRADQRGVDVKVLLDGVGNGFFRTRTFRQLQNGGVEVRRFLHSLWPWRMPLLNLRNHRKLLIVDGRVAFTGSMNIGHVRNLETHFKLAGPIIRHSLDAFSYDWQLTGGPDLPADFLRSHSQASGETAIRAIMSGPAYQRERLRWLILGAMAAAKTRIRIVTPYFVPDKGLLSGLALAAMRGVHIEIFLPHRSNYIFADWACRHQLNDLILAGCDIYLRSDVFDHSKIMTIDGDWALVGSSNWDARSLRLNFEFDLECVDPIWVNTVDGVIDERRDASHLLTPEIYNNRSLFVRLRDSAARLMLPYL